MWSLGNKYDGDEQEYTYAERNTLEIVDNRLYIHKTLQINYTSYDLQQQQDVINPVTHLNVMLLFCEDREDIHPFWYAHIVKIFHVMVRHLWSTPQVEHTPSEPQHMDILWVRWFGLDANVQGGWSKKHLHGVSFIPWDKPGPFGFLDPARSLGGSISSLISLGAGQIPDSLYQLCVQRKIATKTGKVFMWTGKWTHHPH